MAVRKEKGKAKHPISAGVQEFGSSGVQTLVFYLKSSQCRGDDFPPLPEGRQPEVGEQDNPAEHQIVLSV